MRMSDFVVREAIIPDLTSTTKDEVIREMISGLASAGKIDANNVEEVFGAIQRREALGSTGIGRGVAIPHTKHGCVEQLVGTIAVSGPGVPFDSLDGEPVHVLVLLVSPLNQPTEHLKALENVSKALRDDLFVKALQLAESQDGIWNLIQDDE